MADQNTPPAEYCCQKYTRSPLPHGWPLVEPGYAQERWDAISDWSVCSYRSPVGQGTCVCCTWCTCCDKWATCVYNGCPHAVICVDAVTVGNAPGATDVSQPLWPLPAYTSEKATTANQRQPSTNCVVMSISVITLAEDEETCFLCLGKKGWTACCVLCPLGLPQLLVGGFISPCAACLTVAQRAQMVNTFDLKVSDLSYITVRAHPLTDTPQRRPRSLCCCVHYNSTIHSYRSVAIRSTMPCAAQPSGLGHTVCFSPPNKCVLAHYNTCQCSWSVSGAQSCFCYCCHLWKHLMFMQEIVHHAHKLHEDQVTKQAGATNSTQMQQVPQMAAPGLLVCNG